MDPLKKLIVHALKLEPCRITELTKRIAHDGSELTRRKCEDAVWDLNNEGIIAIGPDSVMRAIVDVPVCDTCKDTHRMTIGGQGPYLCTACPVPCRGCARDDGRGAFCEKTPCGCPCHKRGETPSLDAFEQLTTAALNRASAGPYADMMKQTAHELRRSALLYAMAELENHFRGQRIPRGHVGDEPSVFDGIEFLRQKVWSK